MATATFSSAPSDTTSVSFRTWGKGFSDAFATVGMVKTTDTGQIDWATVSNPSNAYVGYEVWRFNDSLQATFPIFFKMEYGDNGGTPALRLSVGKGSDGAGTITNAFGTTFITGCGGSPTTPYPSHVSSGDGSMLVLSGWTGYLPAAFAIERSRDSVGVATGHAITIMRNASGTQPYYFNIFVYSTRSNFSLNNPLPSPLPTNTALASGGTAPMFSSLLADGQGHYWKTKAVMQYMSGDAALGVSVTVSGGWGTYMPAWNNFTSYSCGAMAWY